MTEGTAASPVWQVALFALAAAFLLWEVWRGWRRGLVRSLLHFVAFVVSAVVGFGIGQSVGSMISRFLPGYGLLIGLLVGLFLTLAILAVALLASALLFKRTDQQPGGVRWVFGLGGAFFGLLTGLAILWGAVTLVRTTGSLAGMIAPSGAPDALPLTTRSLVTLKESLELGPAGKLVESVDPVPPQVYDTLARVGQLTSDPDAMMRFLDAPGVREVVQSPEISALLNDHAIAEAASRGDYLALMQNPKLFQAVSNPELSKLLLKIDLQKALDYAVPTPQSSPPPQGVSQ